MTAADAGPGGQRGAQLDAARRREQLDGQHAREAVDRAAQLAAGRPSHRDVVLLHRRGGDRVDARGDRQPLELGDDRRLRVLGDHQAGVDARVVGEERREAGAALHVEEAVRAALGDRGDVRDGDGEEVEDVADRRAVEVAVGLHAPVGRDDGVVDRRGELAVGDQRRVGDRVAGGAADLRRAAQRVGVLHPRVLGAAMARDDRAVRQDGPHVRRGDGLARLRAQRLQVGGEDAVGPEQPLDAHGRRDVGDDEQLAQVREREQEHAQHALGPVDEPEPLLLAQRHRGDAGGGQRRGRAGALAGAASAPAPRP